MNDERTTEATEESLLRRAVAILDGEPTPEQAGIARAQWELAREMRIRRTPPDCRGARAEAKKLEEKGTTGPTGRERAAGGRGGDGKGRDDATHRRQAMTLPWPLGAGPVAVQERERLWRRVQDLRGTPAALRTPTRGHYIAPCEPFGGGDGSDEPSYMRGEIARLTGAPGQIAAVPWWRRTWLALTPALPALPLPRD